MSFPQQVGEDCRGADVGGGGGCGESGCLRDTFWEENRLDLPVEWMLKGLKSCIVEPDLW